MMSKDTSWTFLLSHAQVREEESGLSLPHYAASAACQTGAEGTRQDRGGLGTGVLADSTPLSTALCCSAWHLALTSQQLPAVWQLALPLAAPPFTS